MATTAFPPLSDDSTPAADERRAGALLERALLLAERGDLRSAVQSCRQAIAAAPQAPQGYSMLALLLERAGDDANAIRAYERVLRLAPDSVLERESLNRLRAAPPRSKRPTLTFEEDELFEHEIAAPVAVSPTSSAGPIPADVAVQNAAADLAIAAKIAEARRAAASAGNGGEPGAGTAEGLAATATPGVWPLTLETPQPRTAPSWQKLLQRPTPYFRGVPVAAAAALSLLFVLWANNFAASRAPQSPPPAPEPVLLGAAPEPPRPTVNPSDLRAADPAQPNTIANSPASESGAVTPNPAAGSAAPSTPVASPNATSSAAPSTPPHAGSSPSTPVAAPDADGADTSALPQPSADSPQPRNPVSTPPDSGGASLRGAPLGPAGSPPRNFERVTPGGARPVARPENRAAGDERAAGNDARSGRTGAALERLSRAIDSGGPDIALRLQQRAQYYLQYGEPALAAADFHAAINAYSEMIARGDRVAVARSGIAACRRGVQMAQAQLQEQAQAPPQE